MRLCRDDLLRYDFPSFINKTLATVNPGAAYIPNWHIELIAEYLEAARRSEVTRLIINMPPRYLKSVCVSVAWPAWILGHNPSTRIMTASYSSVLSLKHSIDCRLVIESEWFRKVFPDCRLASDQNEKHKFMTTRRGFRFATSVGGAATGEGGNFLIIDDPLSAAQAMNRKARSGANTWFDQTFASRLDDKQKGVIVLVMQRLHREDLTGHLLDKGGWRQLSLPAVAEENLRHDFGHVRMSREEGILLQGSRENQELMERAKIELGSAAFAAQYQQKPLAEESAMVKSAWLSRYAAVPAMMECIVQSWDTAIKNAAHNDPSVCLTFGESQGKSYLLDAYVCRLEYPDLKRQLIAMAEKWNVDALLIEDKASGQQLLQDLKRETALPMIAYKPKSDKISRFAAISAMLESGRLVLPKQASWLADFERELIAFPNAAHDDQVDSLTQYFDWMRRRKSGTLRIRTI